MGIIAAGTLEVHLHHCVQLLCPAKDHTGIFRLYGVDVRLRRRSLLRRQRRDGQPQAQGQRQE